jgi:hypothetical protein
MTNCKSCGAPVEWVTTELGKKMPIDPEPVEYGGFALEQRAVGQVAVSIASIIKRAGQYNGQRYASHFQTCPSAELHRRKA